MPNILIMPTPLRHRPGRYREILNEAGFTPIDPPGDHRLSESDLIAAMPEIDALLAGGDPVTTRMIEVAPRLRAIARAGVGYESVDLSTATARKIPVAITPGANHASVAEQVFALLLALTRNLMVLDRSIRDGGWDRRAVRPLRGTTMGVVGLGRIGRSVVTRALAFGMRVVVFDRNQDPEFKRCHGIEYLPLNDLLAASDVVSVHLPMNDSTLGIFNREAFARMRPGALFINTARGGLVVEADLAESLTAGHLAGAGLDVMNFEPPEPDNPLLTMQNVVLSPHIGGVDSTALDDMAEQAARIVIDLYRGQWPEACVVNDELRQGWRW
ncbi:phosphoglycerate dehydrogenase [Singulisphaera sp. Ch08]|uniref:Phosphoglycerate dehydrogenase n=1 Tax=Singulisphaera sp. Ch08 TaxID=3120278 RepID=A0AAU7C6I8_9BACT